MSSGSFKAFAWDQMSRSDARLLDYCTLDPDPVPAAFSAGNAAVSAAGNTEAPSADRPAESPAGEKTVSRATYAEPAARSGSEFLNLWKDWERTLRLNLSRNRALKLRREAPVEAPELPSDAVAAAKAAMSIDSPLEAELSLDKARWDAIQNIQGMDIFSEGAIYAYLLKLLLMERRAAFDTEAGFTEYKALYTAILGEAR